MSTVLPPNSPFDRQSDVVVPFGNYIVPKLDFLGFALPKSAEQVKTTTATFSINSFRLKRQLIYFAVTAQIVGFAMENFLPYVTRKVFSQARKMRNKDDEDVGANDREEEKVYLERVRDESELPEYDIYADYAEMVVQVHSPSPNPHLPQLTASSGILCLG